MAKGATTMAAGTSTKRRKISFTEEMKRFLKALVFPMFANIQVNANEDDVLRAKLDIWFDAKNRDVMLYQAVGTIKIVGPRWHSLSTPEKPFVSGDGRRTINAGDILWVRMDSRAPDVLDVEFKDQVFKVKTYDFKERYAPWLKEIC